MATSLTNNTLTLNSQNYTAGTGGMLSIVPVGIQTFRNVKEYGVPVDWTLSSISVGEAKRWTSECYRTSDNKILDWSIKLPSSGTYISDHYGKIINLGNLTGNDLNVNMSGGTTLMSRGSNSRYGGGYLSESLNLVPKGEVAA